MKVIPLLDSESFKSSVLSILNSAKAEDEIYACYFSIRDDKYGNLFLSAIYQAACRGASVHLVLDDYGCMHSSDHGSDYESKALTYEHLMCLSLVGVQISLYHVIENTDMFSWANIKNWETYSKRNHNKLFVFNIRSTQSRGLITGDSQWVNEHFTSAMKGSNIYIEDVDIYIESKLYIKKLINSFRTQKPNFLNIKEEIINKIEESYREQKIANKKFAELNLKQMIFPKMIRFVYSDIEFSNAPQRHTIQNYEIELLRRAEKRVLYSTPYFSPDLEMQKELINANQRVSKKMTLLLGKFRDDEYLPYGVRSTASNLIKNDLRLMEYTGVGNIHYKDMIVDNFSFFKSSNGEGRSRFYNLESGVVIKSKELADIMVSKIKQDIHNSDPITKDTKYTNKHNFIQKLKGLTLKPFFFKHL